MSEYRFKNYGDDFEDAHLHDASYNNSADNKFRNKVMQSIGSLQMHLILIKSGLEVNPKEVTKWVSAVKRVLERRSIVSVYVSTKKLKLMDVLMSTVRDPNKK